jgi:hypothetical protein
MRTFLAPDELDRALQRAVERCGRDLREQPTRLRVILTASMDPADVQRHRHTIHALVASAEEQVPAQLRSATGWARVDEITRELARVRGWTLDAAHAVVARWLPALGVGPHGLPTVPPAAAPTAPAPRR